MSGSAHQSEAPRDGGQNRLDLREYFGLLIDAWPKILLMGIAGLLCAGYIAWRLAPVYEATSLMRVESSQNMAPRAFMEQQFANMAGGGAGLQAVSAEAGVLRSRSVLGQAVDRLALRIETHPVFFPVVGEPLARLTGSNESSGDTVGYFSGGGSLSVSALEVENDRPFPELTLIVQTGGQYLLKRADDEEVLRGRVGETASGLLPSGARFRIHVASLDANVGAAFKVDYKSRAQAIGDLQRNLLIEERPQGSGLLHLTLFGPGADAAERRLDAVMSAYLAQSVEKESQAAQNRLEFLQGQLPEIREQRENAEQALRDYQTRTGTLDLGTEASAIFQRITSLDQQAAALQLRREELLQEYTPQHPQVRSVEEKIAAISRQRDELRGQLRELPEAESQLLELQRDVRVSNELYNQMLNTSQGLEVSKAGVTGATHIVDSAYASIQKVAPHRLLISLIGAIIGALLAVFWVIGKNILRTTIDDPDYIEEQYGLSVFATVPFSSSENATGKGSASNILALRDPEDPSVESIRSLCTSIQFAVPGSGTKHIGISGPTPGCGKSFISVNTATLLAKAGHNVLLVDADMRRGHLYKRFVLNQKPGLSDVLSRHANAESVLQDSGVDYLSVITTGKRPPNPAELLLSTAFTEFKEKLESRFDYVIFDLPPILNVTDTNIVARSLDATFLVIRSEQSTRHEVAQSVQKMERDGLKASGVVFNGLHVNRSRYGQSRYGYYAYKY